MRGNTQTYEPNLGIKCDCSPTPTHGLRNTGSFSLTYDASGRLKTDPVRGITSIGYDNDGRYMYGDKERLPENGMNEYDFAARQYVASQMRFTTPDPLAEERPGLSPYIYCNSNPIMLIDPSGKQTIGVHGTASNPNTFEHKEELQDFTKRVFGNNHNSNNYFTFQWSGGNYRHMRTEGANKLIDRLREIRETVPVDEPLTLIGHSHGGNVIIEAVNKMMTLPEFDGIEINIITINTPVRNDYQLNDEALNRVRHINVYETTDWVQKIGGNSVIILPQNPGTSKLQGECGKAERTFKNAINIPVDKPQSNPFKVHNSHNKLDTWTHKIKF